MQKIKNKIKNDNLHKKLLFNSIEVKFVDQPKSPVNSQKVLSKIEKDLPYHLFSGYVNKIIFGNFDFFEERDFNAYYDKNAKIIYIRSKDQDNNIDLYDDLIHEFSHAVQSKYKNYIFSDGKVKAEFVKKRLKLFYSLIIDYGKTINSKKFLITSFDKELDDLFYKTIGYTKMQKYIKGVFPSAYAPTSLDEYWAEGFEMYFLNKKEELLNICPRLFAKIDTLYQEKINEDN
mgnify:CR=1 FL=1